MCCNIHNFDTFYIYELSSIAASNYTGVSWHSQNRKWLAQLCLGSQTKIFGGLFFDEREAAKKVNNLCDEYDVEYKNPELVLENTNVIIMLHYS